MTLCLTSQWGTDPRVSSHELTELNYLFFQISCHSIWSISHLHTIPIKRCAFLYALMTDALMSFPTLFIWSLVEVHRSSSKSHGLFFLIFIHRILLHLSLEDFSMFEPVHIIGPIGATFHICLLFYVLWNQEFTFVLLVFSTHAFMYLLSVSRIYMLIQLCCCLH